MKLERALDGLSRVISWRGVILLVDLCAAAVACFLLVFVLLNFSSIEKGVVLIAATTALSIPALLAAGAAAQIWRRVSLTNLVALFAAATLVSLASAGISLLMDPPRVAMRVLLGSIPMLVAAWAGPRVLVRLWREWQEAQLVTGRPQAEPILLYGSGARAEAFLRSNQESLRYKVVGFLHDDPRLRGVRLRGVNAFGPLEKLGDLIATAHRLGLQPKRLVISEDNERPDELRAALDAAAAHGLRLSRLPSMLGLLEGGAPLIRPVSIDDILHREQVRLNDPRVEHSLNGATVLVTGAGGSIGSELARQIAGFLPARLIMLDGSEYNLYRIDAEMGRAFPKVERVPVLCDIRDLDALRRVFKHHRPKMVLHAAALKHVPLLEDHAAEAVRTNVQGTRNVALAASESEVEVMTLVSTDKAVNPTNVMGCTKRWAEIICQSLDAQRREGKIHTRYVCVRFGNVLDSAGSVVPLFREQIARGGPVTVTHEDVTRYFMTIPEACELILTAAAATMESHLADSHVYVLDMGEPVKIVSLAERMIQLHGLRPGHDIQINITGLRPGEKLYEELAHESEELMPAPIAKAHLAPSRAPHIAVVEDAVARLLAAADRDSRDQIISALQALVPEFRPETPVQKTNSREASNEPVLVHRDHERRDSSARTQVNG